jgi:FMN reductase
MTGERALVVCGSRRRPSRTRALAERLRDHATEASLDVDALDLGETAVQPFDGRDFEEYDDETTEAVEAVLDADVLLLATPIYFAGYAGGLKDLIDHLPYERFSEDDRSAGIVATGRDERHSHVPDAQLRATLVYLGVDVATPTAFATEDDFDGFDLVSTSVDERLGTVVGAAAALAPSE